MSRQLRSSWAILSCAIALTGLSGCGGGDADTISAKTSGFKVADDNDTGSTGSDSAEAQGQSNGGTQRSTNNTSGGGAANTTQTSTSNTTNNIEKRTTIGQGNQTSAGGKSAQGNSTNKQTGNSKTAKGGSKTPVAKSKTPLAPLSKPPTVSADELDDYKVPKKLDELIDFLAKMDTEIQKLQRLAGELTPDAFYRRVARIFRAKMEACNRMLQLSGLPEKHRVAAVRGKMDGLTAIFQTSPDKKESAKAKKELLAFGSKAFNDKDNSVAAMARILVLRLEVMDFISNKKKKPEDFVLLEKKLNKILEFKEAGIREFVNLRDVGFMLTRSGNREKGLSFLRKVGLAFKNHPTKLVSKGAGDMLRQLAYLQFQNRMVDALQQKPDEGKSINNLMKGVVDALNEVPESFLQMLTDVKMAAEYQGNVPVAAAAYGAMGKWISNQQSPPKQLQRLVHMATLRIALIRQSVKINGQSSNGKTFNWAKYRGKVVLVDFWATWCKPCIAELPVMKKALAKYGKHGFEIVGINLDENPKNVRKFMEDRDITWETVMPTAPDQPNQNAERCGVEGIPFMFLVDRKGVVMAIHTRGNRLERLLARHFYKEKKITRKEAVAVLGPDFDKKVKELPKGGNRKGKTKTKGTPKAKQPSKKQAVPGKKQSSVTVNRDYFFVSFEDKKEEKEKAAKAPAKKKEKKVNPYLAEAGLSARELVEFLLDMKEKPKSIQQREGFVAAVGDAADRVLKAKKANGKFKEIAVVTNLDVLHSKACLGDEGCEKQLRSFAKRVTNLKRKKVASYVAFLTLEAKTMETEELDEKALEKLLSEVHTFSAKTKLTQRHLRLASNTVGVINRIVDGDKREAHFKKFGDLFAKSSYRRLSRYGKALAKAKAGSSALGKMIEVKGATALGDQFDVKAYRGKYVIVDFWATWCGPCVREIPNLKRIYKTLKSKSLEVAAVNLDRDPKALTKFLDEKKIGWVNIIGDDAKAIARKYQVAAIPTVMLVDPKGKIIHVGHRLNEVEKKLQKLLKK